MNDEAKATYYCAFLIFKFPYTDEKIEIKIYTKTPDRLKAIKKDIEYFIDKIVHKYR